MPVDCGCTTVSIMLAATQASTADPQCSNACSAARAGQGCAVATAQCAHTACGSADSQLVADAVCGRANSLATYGTGVVSTGWVLAQATVPASSSQAAASHRRFAARATVSPHCAYDALCHLPLRAEVRRRYHPRWRRPTAAIGAAPDGEPLWQIPG